MPSIRLLSVSLSASLLLMAACSSGEDDQAAPVVVPGATGGTGQGGAGGSEASAGQGGNVAAGTTGAAGKGGAGTGTSGSGGSASSTGGAGGANGGSGGKASSGAGGTGTSGSGGSGKSGASGAGGGKAGSGGSGTAGTGGSSANACPPVTFPTGLVLETVTDAALTAQYKALGVGSCTLPKCFIDTENLVSPDGTKHDIHVNVGVHFALYELVGTEVDPNGTGSVDPAHAYSTRILLSPDFMSHLDKLRDAYGGPVNITSGFRSPPHQHAICQSICGVDQCTDGSGAVTCAKNSRHMWGAAADMSLMYESAANQASFPFVFHENGGTGPHLHVDMQACQ